MGRQQLKKFCRLADMSAKVFILGRQAIMSSLADTILKILGRQASAKQLNRGRGMSAKRQQPRSRRVRAKPFLLKTGSEASAKLLGVTLGRAFGSYLICLIFIVKPLCLAARGAAGEKSVLFARRRQIFCRRTSEECLKMDKIVIFLPVSLFNSRKFLLVHTPVSDAADDQSRPSSHLSEAKEVGLGWSPLESGKSWSP